MSWTRCRSRGTFWLCSFTSLQASIWHRLSGWSASGFLSRKLGVDLKQKVEARLTAVVFPAARYCRNRFKKTLSGVRFLLSRNSRDESSYISVEMINDVFYLSRESSAVVELAWEVFKQGFKCTHMSEQYVYSFVEVAQWAEELRAHVNVSLSRTAPFVCVR